MDKFYKQVKAKIDHCVPYKKGKPKRPRPPWMDKAAQTQIKKKAGAWTRYQERVPREIFAVTMATPMYILK